MNTWTISHVAFLALMACATSAVAQTTEGEDAINSLGSLFAGTAADTFDSDGVARRFFIRYSEIEVNEWSFLDVNGDTTEGSGESGRSVAIGRRSRGLEYEGGVASYGWGFKYTELGSDEDDFSFQGGGLFVDGGYGYGTNLGLDLSLIAEADIAFGDLKFEDVEQSIAPVTFGLGIEASYNIDAARVSVGAGRYWTNSAFLDRTQGEEVLEEFFTDTTRINATVAFSF